MTDFDVRFSGDSYKGMHIVTYYGYDRDSMIVKAKQDGKANLADEISISHKNNGKYVGCWFRKGSQWYSIKE